MAKMLSLLALLIGLGVVLSSPAPVKAHGTCYNMFCCSPHGQWSSSTGCSFGGCSYDNAGTWDRSVLCWEGSQGSAGCGCSSQCCCGGTSVDENHNVSSIFYGTCEDVCNWC
jgi:hypothetical protein